MRNFKALLLLACSCCSGSETQTSDSIKGLSRESIVENEVTFEMEQLLLTSGSDCTEDKSSCAKVTIHYPDFKGLAEGVEERIQIQLARSFQHYVPNAERASSLRQLASSFLENVEEQANQNSGEKAWLLSNISITLLSDSILSMANEADCWVYAHFDNRETRFINIDPTTGDRISIDTLLSENEKRRLQEFIRRDLSDDFQGAENELSDELKWLVPLHLKLNKIGFSEKGYLFYYKKEYPLILIPYDIVGVN